MATILNGVPAPRSNRMVGDPGLTWGADRRLDSAPRVQPFGALGYRPQPFR